MTDTDFRPYADALRAELAKPFAEEDVMTDDDKARLVEEMAEAMLNDLGAELLPGQSLVVDSDELRDMAAACLPIVDRYMAAHDLDAVKLRAQVKYLRDYAISKAADVVTATNGGNHPTPAQYSALIGGIDGNIAVVGDRAVAKAKAATGEGDV